jgi:uncharacterized damage-inducible protein DinB
VTGVGVWLTTGDRPHLPLNRSEGTRLEAPPYKEEPAKSQKELLDKFDKNVKAARASIAGASDEQFMQNWSLLAGGKNLFTMPRVVCIRSFVMNHTIHHRAQLGVYLRMNDIPVPAIYGPSADEGNM